MIYFSGIKQQKKLASEVYDWFCEQRNIGDVDITVHSCDLTDDNVFAWCEQEDDEFIISIHSTLSVRDYIVTLIHELIHVSQSLCGLFDDTLREKEAYELEYELASQFLLDVPHVELAQTFTKRIKTCNT